MRGPTTAYGVLVREVFRDFSKIRDTVARSGSLAPNQLAKMEEAFSALAKGGRAVVNHTVAGYSGRQVLGVLALTSVVAVVATGMGSWYWLAHVRELTPLTAEQKRGVDLIDSSAGWDWTSRLAPANVGDRLNMPKQVFESAEWIWSLPGDPPSSSVWKIWASPGNEPIGRNRAIQIVLGWIANKNPDEGSQFLVDLTNAVNAIRLNRSLIDLFSRLSADDRNNLEAAIPRIQSDRSLAKAAAAAKINRLDLERLAKRPNANHDQIEALTRIAFGALTIQSNDSVEPPPWPCSRPPYVQNITINGGPRVLKEQFCVIALGAEDGQ